MIANMFRVSYHHSLCGPKQVVNAIDILVIHPLLCIHVHPKFVFGIHIKVAF